MVMAMYVSRSSIRLVISWMIRDLRRRSKANDTLETSDLNDPGPHGSHSPNYVAR